MMPMLPFAPSPSVVTAYARVDKATSEFLNCPDWRINIGICDTINAKPWLAKDYIKATRTRLQHKNPNVQLLTLTLLETLVKNCSEYIHAQMAERKILHEMIKIVKKKTHMRVREKILVLIDTWQEAFSGRGGRTSQYHHAYDELRRYGVEFPRRSPNSVPIITPPASFGHSQSGAGSSSRHESTSENMTFSTLESMRTVSDLLSEMLQAIDPKDRSAVKDEVIVDLVDQCRSNQKKLGQMLASTTDEELLRRSLQFNDTLQYIIEKHDAIASGSPIPVPIPSSVNQTSDVQKTRKHIENTDVNSKSSSFAASASASASAPVVSVSVSNEIEEEGSSSSNSPPVIQSQISKNEEKQASDPSLTMALVLSDPPLPSNKKSAEDMIDFLSVTLSPVKTPPIPQPENQTPVQLNNYVVPWAQSQSQQPQPQPQLQFQPEFETQPGFQQVSQQSNYIPPPWAPTPGYYCNPYASTYSTGNYYNNGSASSGANLNQYIPSYRLFEDLNVLGNLRTNSGSAPGNPSMLRK